MLTRSSLILDAFKSDPRSFNRLFNIPMTKPVNLKPDGSSEHADPLYQEALEHFVALDDSFLSHQQPLSLKPIITHPSYAIGLSHIGTFTAVLPTLLTCSSTSMKEDYSWSHFDQLWQQTHQHLIALDFSPELADQFLTHQVQQAMIQPMVNHFSAMASKRLEFSFYRGHQPHAFSTDHMHVLFHRLGLTHRGLAGFYDQVKTTPIPSNGLLLELGIGFIAEHAWMSFKREFLSLFAITSAAESQYRFEHQFSISHQESHHLFGTPSTHDQVPFLKAWSKILVESLSLQWNPDAPTRVSAQDFSRLKTLFSAYDFFEEHFSAPQLSLSHHYLLNTSDQMRETVSAFKVCIEKMELDQHTASSTKNQSLETSPSGQDDLLEERNFHKPSGDASLKRSRIGTSRL